MSMSHKAYAFDWQGFIAGLAPCLNWALENDQRELLCKFVRDNLSDCSNPYDGAPLNDDWQSLLSEGDVQELADFALTKYYLPDSDFGLGRDWLSLTGTLSALQNAALLGSPFGPPSHLFDPGRQGSYFQSEAEVERSLGALSACANETIQVWRACLANMPADRKGLYVTF